MEIFGGALERGKGAEGKIERERKRALEQTINRLDTVFEREKKHAFEAKGREFPLQSAEDAMVAHAQNLHRITKGLYEQTLKDDNYREEQAVVKLLRLFESHAKTMALFAELKRYYPEAAARIEGYLPALKEASEHGEVMWNEETKQ